MFIPHTAPEARPVCKSLRVVYGAEDHDRLDVEQYEDRSDDDQEDVDEVDTSGIDHTEHRPAIQTPENAESNDGELEAEHDPIVIRTA